MLELTARQRRTLESACDTLIPSIESDGDPHGFWRRKGTDFPTADIVLELISGQPPEKQQQFRQLLDLLESPVANLIWGRRFRPFWQLKGRQQERILRRWSTSRLATMRSGFAALKKLCLFAYYGFARDGGNPAWEAIGYPGPIGSPVSPHPPLRPLPVDGPLSLSCQVLVIGSGAGGGVVAGELARSGKDVIVIEKGPYLPESQFDRVEGSMLSRLYEGRAAAASEDGSISLLAGSCLGGGTLVNWAGSLRTPDYILEEWAKDHDLPSFLEDSYQESMDAVCQAIGVKAEGWEHNAQNQALWDGSIQLGHRVGRIPRNVAGCPNSSHPDCGFCGFGCSSGGKQSTQTTYLRQAADHGARFLVDCEVEKILVESGRASGALAYGLDEQGQRCEIRIRADQVAVCAGSLHTPALLKRSGLSNEHIGRHLHLHPTSAVGGFYPHAIESWYGPTMTVVNDEFARLDGNFGFKLETPLVHAGSYAAAVPWVSGRQHKQLMLEAKRAAHFIVLTRDRYSGEVASDGNGRPVVKYRLHPYDLKHLLRGLIEMGRIHFEAGAESIGFPHYSNRVCRNRDELEKAAGEIESWNWDPNRFSLFSAHQMSTCRMAGSPQDGVVSPQGESFEVQGLFLADGSVLPRCSGVNPMLTIMSVAHWIAQGMK